jgi:hypothetical protein
MGNVGEPMSNVGGTTAQRSPGDVQASPCGVPAAGGRLPLSATYFYWPPLQQRQKGWQ